MPSMDRRMPLGNARATGFPISYGPAPLPPSEDSNPLRKLAFYGCLGMILTRWGLLPELLFYLTHTNTYILYLVAPPAFLGVLLTGGIGRTMSHRSAWLWVGFFLWMIVATPFSNWPGGSTALLLDYGRFCFPMLFVMAGLISTWKEIRAVMYTMALALVLNCITVRLFGRSDDDGRLQLESSGQIGNSNDLASHFILLLPIALFVLMDKRTNALIRTMMVFVLAYGCYVIFACGSRGALIAVGCMFLFTLFRATVRQKAVALIAVTSMAVILPVILPGNTFARMASLFGAADHEEAKESKDSRAYLFQKSVAYTFQFPIFGVGPDQFGLYEGFHSKIIGDHGDFHATHCAYTEVSSECGVPALLLFLGGIISVFAAVSKTHARAKREGHLDIVNLSFCYMLSMLGFLVSIIFLANAYRFYLSALIGLGIALYREANRYMDNATLSAQTATPQPVPAFTGRAAFRPLQRA